MTLWVNIMHLSRNYSMKQQNFAFFEETSQINCLDVHYGSIYVSFEGLNLTVEHIQQTALMKMKIKGTLPAYFGSFKFRFNAIP